MQTMSGTGPSPAGSIGGGEARTISQEIDFRMRRLAHEAERERLAGPREGLRAGLGHAIVALGLLVHGIETDQPARPALRTR